MSEEAVTKADPTVEVEQMGTLPNGQVVLKYTLKNGLGSELEVLEYGGTVRRWVVPGPDGKPRDVIVGPDTLEGWIKEPYYGALIGRVGNRIANGKFTVEGKTYNLATNNEPGGLPCALHGGLTGWNARLWKIKHFFDGDDACIRLTYDSPDGEEGYAGNVHVEVVYALTPENTWKISYSATTDALTPLNMTQHAYFNLKGCGCGTIVDHQLEVNATRYTPVTAGLIPTGELASVEGTPFDFQAPHKLGDAIDADNDQIRYGAGYDHNFVLNHAAGELAFACRLQSPDGLAMEVWTDQPGIQVYTGNYIPDGMQTPQGPTCCRGGVALETQHFADSVNHPEFPTIFLAPGQTFQSRTEYRFPRAK